MGANQADRVLVIGLDMGDASLIERWGREGALPTLQSIMTEGSWGRLATTAEVLHTSSWPTIFTGTLPGRHGVYYPYQPCPGTQKVRHIGPEQYGVPSFWQILHDLGRRCIVLDAPETYPGKGFTGIQIFEWGTWAWYWKRMSVPSEIERKIRRRFGAYPLKLEAKQLGLGMPDVSYLHKRLIASAAHKAQTTKWLMRQYPWDLFLVVFAELHPAGHYLWPRGTPAPSLEPSLPTDEELKELKDVYVAVDSAIGEILRDCDDQVTVFLTSGDGVGPNRCAWHLLPEVLTRLGFTKSLESISQNGHQKRTLLQGLRSAVPANLRSAISSYLPWQLRDSLVSRLATGNTDWSRSKAYCLPTDLEGCIRINLRGREPQGIVEPGRQYEDVCSELTECFKDLINPKTGKCAVRQVWRVDHLFPGDRRHHLPDLTVIWNDEEEIRELFSNRTGLVSKPPVDPRTGTHYPRAFFAARGAKVKSGAFTGKGHIADVAPTILSCLDIAPSRRMDGRVLGVTL